MAGVAEFKGRLKRQSYHRRKTPQGELKRPGTDEGGSTARSRLQGRLNPAAAVAAASIWWAPAFQVAGGARGRLDPAAPHRIWPEEKPGAVVRWRGRWRGEVR